MTFRIHRRDALHGLSLGAGASFLAPLLRQSAQAQTMGTFPRRFVFVLEGNSAEPVNFVSQNASDAFTTATGQALTGRWHYNQYNALQSVLDVPNTDFSTAPGLASVLDTGSGVSLQNDAAVLMGLSSRVAGGGHSTHHGALSCTRSSAASAAGQTIDAYLAALPAVRQTTPFDALRVGLSGATTDPPLNYETCAFGRGRAAGILLHPDTAFNTLFGSVASAAGQAAFSQRNALLDFAQNDVTATLATFPSASAERQKLERYLGAVETLTARQARLIEMETSDGALSDNKPADPSSNPLLSSGDPLDRLRAQFELVEAALKGGLTNVAVIASGTGNAHFGVRYSSISNVGRHDLHHGSAGNPTYLSAVHEVTRQHVEMVTTLAKNLKATPEPSGAGGTMLDHTAIVFMSDNGEQHHSTASEWPMLLLGGSALGLQTGGRTVFFPGLNQAGHRQVSNVFNTLGYAAGVALDDFGAEGPTRVAEGPLSEIYG